MLFVRRSNGSCPSDTEGYRCWRRGAILTRNGCSNLIHTPLRVSLPGKFGDMLKVQREYYLPSNQDLVKAGYAISWATTAVRYPVKFDAPYDSISFNGARSLAEADKDPPKEWIEKWPKKNAEWMTLLNASRTRFQGQLWSLVDQTTPK